jgi:hypothetical protein
MAGNKWDSVFIYKLANLTCGKNILKVKAINYNAGSPGGLIFAITML